MDGWSPIVATASDEERSSSEGECTVGTGPKEADEKEGELKINDERMDGGAAEGFGITGFGEGTVRLSRTGQTAEQELRYLHLLWEPSRVGLGAGVASSKPGKVTGCRARRQGRARRNVGPIGKDIYGTEIPHTQNCREKKLLMERAVNSTPSHEV